MLYKTLAETYEKLSSTTKRLEKIDILAEFLEKVSEKDGELLYLLQGEIYPEYDERKIGISNQLAIKALSKATGTNSKKIIQEWKKIGDLGEVARKLTKTKSQTTLQTHILTTQKVIENLRKLPDLEGKGTVDKKISLITELLTSASSIESIYLMRTLIGDLRIGVQESTIKYAIIKAFFPNEENADEIVQRAIDKSNDITEIFQLARKKKLKELENISLEVGKPIKAMLAQKAASIEQAFEALGKPMAVEYKYDGFRLLIHKNKDKIILFTRRLENVTKQFPEVVDYIKEYIGGESFILDSEAVGFDRKTKQYTGFQAISQRIRRKYDIEKVQDKLPVEVNIFDILYYNGKSQLDKPFEERTQLVRKIITNHPYKIIASKMIITSDEKEVNKFYKEALANNQEGVMLKNLKAEYKPGRRVGNMLKLKPEQRDFDLVITGAEWGSGKRSGWLSSFNLSCKSGKEFLEIGKVGTGISEKETEDNKITFQTLTELLKPHIIAEKGKEVTIKPKVIVSVTYQEIQKSPNYKSGVALRFPRFVALREDKPLAEITTLEDIEAELGSQRKESWKYG